MRSASWLRLGVIPLVLVLAACGSSGDDDDDNDDDDAGTEATSPRSANAASGDSGIGEIKSAIYGQGKVHLEVSGDKKESFDADGTGYASDGFALLTYGSQEAAILISLSSNKGEPGALSITTKDFAGAWEWGKDCKLDADQSDDKFKGDFTCDKVDAVSPTSAKEFKISVKGTFTVEP